MADLNRRRAVRHLVARGRRVPVPNPLRGYRALDFPYRRGRTPRGVDPAPDRGTSGPTYDTTWAREWPAVTTRRVVTETVWKGLIEFYGRPEVHGADRLEVLGDGNALFASNHHSHADTPTLMTAIPTPWRHKLAIGAGADYFFPNRVASVASALFIGAVPVARTGVSRRNIDELVQLLKDGWSTVLFPEGGRSPDGWGQEFKGGAAFLAKMAGVPVVPVYLDGTGDILPKGRNWPRRARVIVNFGEPMWIGDEESTKAFTERLQRAVEALGDEHTTDWWRARQRLHAQASPQLSGPDAGAWRRSWARTAKRRRPTKRTWPEL